MNKKYIYTKIMLYAVAFCTFIILLGWAGDIDYTEHCILRMSYEEYDTIKVTLTKQYGHEPTERQIARYWADHNM